MKTEAKIKLPDTLVIMSGILLVMTILTWVIDAGEFERVEVDGRTLVVPGTYTEVESSGQGIADLLISPIKGLIGAAQIIAFVLVVGGAFQIIQKTDAIQAGLQRMVKYATDYPSQKHFIIPLLTILFSLAGATFGMSEETLVFILVTIPLAKSLGYDSLVGVAIPFLGAGAGFAGAFSNPFTIGIAQAIAEIAPFSGIGYRLIVWTLMTFTTTFFIMRYAIKISKKPEHSLVKNITPETLEKTEFLGFNTKKKWVLFILFSGIACLIFGVTQLGWYINEIAALFLVMGLLSAIVERMSANSTADYFMQGAKEMLTAAMVIGFSRGVLVLAEDGKIIDTILYSMSSIISELPPYISVQSMFFFQTFLNFFIPSGSGQAALTMPIMTPLSDLLGISRQTAVLAFQLGDGLSNMIIPTSGVTMGVLSIAKIPYQIWLKWALPLVLILTVIGMLALLPPVLLFYWP
ncbi:MAG: YfcC family protein [Cyclobacteriaceae bacterium]